MAKLDNITVHVDADGEIIDGIENMYEQYLVIKDRLDKQEKQLNEQYQDIKNKLDSQERELGRIWRQLYSFTPLKIFVPLTAGMVLGGSILTPILNALIK